MIRAGLSAACALALSTSCASCRDSPAHHLEQASEAVFAKHFDQALGEYRLALLALERDRTPEAQVWRARALRGAADIYYLELKDYRRAVQTYRELNQQCPEAPETLAGRIHLADLLEREFRDLRGAIAELSAALARNPPQSAELAYRIAKLYFQLGDYRQCDLEALSVTRRFETSPLVDDAYFLRAQALAMVENRRGDAVRAFRELLERFPDSELAPHALFEMGKVLAEAGEAERAIEVWIEALKNYPEPEVVQGAIARARAQLRATTPASVGNAIKAFDRDIPGTFFGARPKKKPATSVEAAGGTAEEAAQETVMAPERAAPKPAEPAAAPTTEEAPAP